MVKCSLNHQLLPSGIYFTFILLQNENRLQPKVHRFHLGMKVEVIHPKKPSIIALATITKSLGPYLYQVTTEPIPNLPSHTFYGQGDNAGIFSCGWAEKFGIDIPLPVCKYIW